MKGISAVTLGLLVGLLILGFTLTSAQTLFKGQTCVTPELPRLTQCGTAASQVQCGQQFKEDFLCKLEGIEQVRFQNRVFWVIKGSDLTVSRVVSDLAAGRSIQEIVQHFRLNQQQAEQCNLFLTSMAHAFN